MNHNDLELSARSLTIRNRPRRAVSRVSSRLRQAVAWAAIAVTGALVVNYVGCDGPMPPHEHREIRPDPVPAVRPLFAEPDAEALLVASR